jgi:hypothetical protein
MLGTTEWLHNLWPLEWYSAPQSLVSHIFEGKARPAHKADNLTAVYEPIVYTLWDPEHLTPL